MSELMINQNGLVTSAPVYPSPLLQEDLKADILDTDNIEPKAIYTGKYIYAQSRKGLLRVDRITYNIDIILNDYQMPSSQWTYDGSNIWALVIKEEDYIVIQIDPETGLVLNEYPCVNGVNGSKNLPEMTTSEILKLHGNSGSVSDGSNIWFRVVTKDLQEYLIKFNTESFRAKGINLPNEITLQYANYFSIIYDGSKTVWTMTHSNTVSYITSLDIETDDYISHEAPNGLAITYDGVNLWYLNFWGANKLLCKFDTVSGQSVEYPFETVDAFPSLYGCYDGRYIWYPAHLSGKGLYRVDPGSGEVKFIQVKNAQWSQYSHVYLLFDGRYLWASLHGPNGYRLAKIYYTNESLSHTITIQFHDELGQSLRPSAIGYADDRDSFTASAPEIDGYTYTGYQIDNGNIHTGTSAILTDIRSDQTITFMYRQGDSGNKLTITEHYQSTDSATLRPATTTLVDPNEDYQKSAPTIAGYKYVGHQIDGTALSSSSVAAIPDAREDHTVTFLYEKEEDPSDGAWKGKCCCSGSLELKFKLPVCNSSGMIEPLTKLVETVKSCDCTCNKE